MSMATAWSILITLFVIGYGIESKPPPWSNSIHNRYPHSSILTRRHSKYDRCPDNKHPQARRANYLPAYNRAFVRGTGQYNFRWWFDDFQSQQQQWCGMPTVPIKFSKKEKAFTNVEYKSWPWMVSLYQRNSYLTALADMLTDEEDINLYLAEFPYGSKHRCGGTLLSPQFVLTAAHCLQYWRLNPNENPNSSEDDNDAGYALMHLVVKECLDRREAAGETVDKTTYSDDYISCEIETIAGVADEFPDDFNLNGAAFNTTELWMMWLGAHLTPPKRDPLNDEGLTRLGIKNIRHYPGSDSLKKLEKKGYHDDLAIIQLAEPVKFSDTVRPICLSDNYEKKMVSKDGCAVAGWGDFFGADDIKYESEQLQHAPYKPDSDKKCRSETKDYSSLKSRGDKVDTGKTICASEKDSHKKKTPGVKTKICSGDSGGPLICKYKDGRWYQVGIASAGERESADQTCEVTDSPDIFTRVPAFSDWIIRTMYEMSTEGANVASLGLNAASSPFG